MYSYTFVPVIWLLLDITMRMAGHIGRTEASLDIITKQLTVMKAANEKAEAKIDELLRTSK